MFELKIDELDKVTGGEDPKPGCQCGGGVGAQGTGPGTGGGDSLGWLRDVAGAVEGVVSALGKML